MPRFFARSVLWAAVETIEREHGFRLVGAEREPYERLLPEADPGFAAGFFAGVRFSMEEAVADAERSGSSALRATGRA